MRLSFVNRCFFILGLSLVVAGSAQAQGYAEYYTKAREAYKAGSYDVFYTNIIEANKLHPYHQVILYYAGIASALTNKPDEAVKYLEKAVQIRSDFSLEIDDLKSLSARGDFKKLLETQKEIKKPIIHSDTAVVIRDRTLHVESIAADANGKIFYAGSIHKRKIIKVTNKGQISDFASSGQDGLTSVFGVRIDEKNKALWACSSPLPEMEGYDSMLSSAVFHYNLGTGKLIKKYTPITDKKDLVFGDLMISPSGEIFVSESKHGVVFHVNKKTGTLDEFFSSPEIWSLQGLAFNEAGTTMFVADYIRGIFKLDMKTKQFTPLKSNVDISLKGIDGLLYHKGSLIAIQNGINPMRVTKLTLSKEQDALTAYTIIDRDHPAFGEPTIGCIAGGKLYYVANSFWSGYNEDHTLKTTDQLQDVLILRKSMSE